MKKILLTSFCAVALAAASFGQGYINWATIVPTYMSAQTNTTEISPLTEFGGGTLGGGTVGNTAAGSSGLSYFWVLLYAPAGTAVPTSVSQLSSWTSTGLYATNAAANRLTPGIWSSPSSGQSVETQLPWASGTTMEVMLAGWSGNLGGANWTNVLYTLQNWDVAGSVVGTPFFGLSAEGAFNPVAAAPGTTPFGPSGSGLIYSPNMQLYVLPVPEPGTLALAAFGGASLLLLAASKRTADGFRRRK